jgi:surface antigen
MKKYAVKFLSVVAVVSLLSGCTNEAGEINKQGLVGAVGAIGGGVIGSQIGKGTGNTAAIIAGTVLGGLLGSEMGKSLDKADVAYHNRTSQSAFENNKSGSASSWKNPDTGASGTITPTKTTNHGGTYCREFTQSINVGGKVEKGYGTACRQQDGSWQVQN